jgi:alkylation response protein AidB-like acyl-CoA dehydrogenase
MSELESWRLKARAWLESVAPTFGMEARRGLSEADDLALGRRYAAARFEAGFAGINWSTEFGGQGLSPLHKMIFEQEEMRFGLPGGYFGVSLGMPVPVVMRFCEDKAWVRERVIAGAERRGDLVPALFRAVGRLGPRRASHAG